MERELRCSIAAGWIADATITSKSARYVVGGHVGSCALGQSTAPHVQWKHRRRAASEDERGVRDSEGDEGAVQREHQRRNGRVGGA